jgi:hypothetical protein
MDTSLMNKVLEHLDFPAASICNPTAVINLSLYQPYLHRGATVLVEL